MNSQPEPVAEDPRQTRVSAIMSTRPVTIGIDADLWTAVRTLVSTGLRHLVVLDAAGRYRGILADRAVVAESRAVNSHWPQLEPAPTCARRRIPLP